MIISLTLSIVLKLNYYEKREEEDKINGVG
jgi:hypothetical protein